MAVTWIGLGGSLIVASPLVESRLPAAWFWSAEDRQAAESKRTHFDRLYAVYIVENKRRGRLGQPKLAEEPEPLRRARVALEAANRPLTLARQRPKQIADACRLAGLILCVAGAASVVASTRM